MRLGIMQPYFFPYLGYISLIKHVDKFILLDDVQFIRHGWIERNRILKPNGGWQYISVPLKKHEQKTCIKDIEINNSLEWKKKILAQLVHYKKAPYYNEIIKMIQDIFGMSYTSITDLDKAVLDKIENYLHIDTPIEVFRDMNLEIEQVRSADEWALNICKAIPTAEEYWNPPGGKEFFDVQKYQKNHINLFFQEINLYEYPQKDNEFEPGLSIIDVMMFNSPEKINEMLDRYTLYE